MLTFSTVFLQNARKKVPEKNHKQTEGIILYTTESYVGYELYQTKLLIAHSTAVICYLRFNMPVNGLWLHLIRMRHESVSSYLDKNIKQEMSRKVRNLEC